MILAEPGGQKPETKPVVDLLTSILNEVQKQVQSKTMQPLEGEALRAVEQFKEIVAALALQPLPTITLIADPNDIPNPGPVTLIWSSTDAQTVSIDPNVGEVTPAAGGSREVMVLRPTRFTATAKGPCGSATDAETVAVGGVVL